MASAAPMAVSASAASPTVSNVPMIYQQTFRDLNASSSANSYIGLYTLQSYDVAKCAAICDRVSLCTAFNIYIERDPSQVILLPPCLCEQPLIYHLRTLPATTPPHRQFGVTTAQILLP
jgi:hypothetical protein